MLIIHDLRIKVLDAAEWNNITNIVTTSRTIYGLSASTEYEVEVRTSYDAGNENVSEWAPISFTTLSPCFTPNNIASSNVDLDGATLSWDGVAGAEGYEVRYKTGANPWINVEVTETSLDLSDLAFATAFNWQVRTICDASVEHMSAFGYANIYYLGSMFRTKSVIYNEYFATSVTLSELFLSNRPCNSRI